MTDQEALFEQVYQIYGPSLYRFCRTTSGGGCSGWR